MPRATPGTSTRGRSRCAAAGRAARSRSATPRTSRRGSTRVTGPGEGAPSRVRPATLAVHAGLPAPAQGAPFLPGPTFAAPYHLIGDADASRFGYGRYDNPTWAGWEEALSALEGGEAVGFASGMAACSAVLFALLRPGDV